jgi:hypothetical protein
MTFFTSKISLLNRSHLRFTVRRTVQNENSIDIRFCVSHHSKNPRCRFSVLPYLAVLRKIKPKKGTIIKANIWKTKAQTTRAESSKSCDYSINSQQWLTRLTAKELNKSAAMMQAAEAAARAAMMEAARRDGIPLGSAFSTHSGGQPVQLDEQQLLFISELEQSSSNGEISGGDQHLLTEVMGLHQGQINFQIFQPEDKPQAPLYNNQQQLYQADQLYQQSGGGLFYENSMTGHNPQVELEQYLMHQQQHAHLAAAPNFMQSIPEEHYLTIAQNGTDLR